MRSVFQNLHAVRQATYLFVPGAWHGAWAWRPVAQRIREAGHRAIALTLPGLGDGDDPAGHKLSDAVDYIVGEARRLELDDVIIVAHSWGGYPATGAAHLLADRVRKLVYYNAFVPTRGRCLFDDNPPELRDPMLELIMQSSAGVIPPCLEYAEVMMQEAAPQMQRLIADLLTPTPGHYFLDLAGFEPTDLNIPIAYVAGNNDIALQPPTATFVARLGIDAIVVPGPHCGMLTHPDEVAKAILAA